MKKALLLSALLITVLFTACSKKDKVKVEPDLATEVQGVYRNPLAKVTVKRISNLKADLIFKTNPLLGGSGSTVDFDGLDLSKEGNKIYLKGGNIILIAHVEGNELYMYNDKNEPYLKFEKQ